MTLSDRVRGILKSGATPLAVAGAPPQPRGLHPSIESVLGGGWAEGLSGRCLVVERTVQAVSRYGAQEVGSVARRLEGGIRELDILLRDARTALPLVFFDLETTGLSGGAATCAFLIGCGWFDASGAFVTRQFLLTDGAHERAFLEHVAGDFTRAGVLVSFNGKSFDAPLLEMRHAYHRLPWIAEELPHLDLLHPARRFWARGLAEAGCSLVTLEQHQLGVHRAHDVDGADIPGRYFRFIRSGDATPLTMVLEHNRRDLLTLAMLTGVLLELIAGGPAAARDAGEAFALGRIYAERRWRDSGSEEQSRAAYRRALGLAGAGCDDAALRFEALRALAQSERRARNFEEAAACWRVLLDDAGCPAHVAREAAEGLAIHHEHRQRNLAAARAFAMRIVEREAGAAWNRAVAHRLSRIDRKLQELESTALLPFPSSSLLPSSGSRMSARRTSS